MTNDNVYHEYMIVVQNGEKTWFCDLWRLP